MEETFTGAGPIEIWQSMGLVGKLVLVSLLLMSIYSITVMIERFTLYRKARSHSLRFVRQTRDALDRNDLEYALKATRSFPRSHVARIYGAAIQNLSRYSGSPPEGFDEQMQRAIEREAVQVTQELKRGLSSLASIGATAPFVGLFGTVVGIMDAFFSMARMGQGGIAVVSAGIAEALVNTAAGLFVALPAVWAFNYFIGHVDNFNVEMRSVGSELTDHFVQRSREPWKSAMAGEN